MRTALVLALGALACSEPRLDLHVVRSADVPVNGKTSEPTPCEDCVSQEWVGADGRLVTLQIEREPFLEVPAKRLSEPELVHEKGLIRPDCDVYSLSFRVAIALDEMVAAAKASEGRVVAALVEGRPIAVDRAIYGGETLRLSFTELEKAATAAANLGAAPPLREGDHSWLADARRSQREMVDAIFSDSEQLHRLAAEAGIAPEDLDKEAVLARLLCP